MSLTVCLRPTQTMAYLNGGGHIWLFLSWALGLRACGCRVIWLEGVEPTLPAEVVRQRAATLRGYLEPHGLGDTLALYSSSGGPLPAALQGDCLDLAAAVEADLLINMRYDMRGEDLALFRRTALVDVDPGLLQIWMSTGDIHVARHDRYFTIGETVGRADARFPDCGVRWHYTPPAVSLSAWQPVAAEPGAAYSTVSQWWGAGKEEWVLHEGEAYLNAKRVSFLEVVDLPRRTSARLELALCLGEDDAEERKMLEGKGWKIRSAWYEIPTPKHYQAFIQQSRGEFSCAKPSCMRLQNAWISDRTLCYLASGKPAIVQHTGPSRFLPDAEGVFRFRTLDEAVLALEQAEADYDRHCRSARALAEEFFDAKKVAAGVLERALD